MSIYPDDRFSGENGHNNKKPRISDFAKKVIASGLAAVLVLTALVSLVGVRRMKAESNMWLCDVGGGFFDSKEVKATYGPGTDGGFRLFDTKANVVADARYFAIDKDPKIADVGGEVKQTPAKDRIMVNPSLQVGFMVNENACQLWSKFLKRRGELHYNDGNKNGGWAAFLADKFRQSVDKAVVPVFQTIDWSDLYYNPKTGGTALWDTLQSQIAKNLQEELKRTLGDDYFCGTSYKFDGNVDGKFECPLPVVSIQSVLPANMALITNKEDIKANEEAVKVIESQAAKSKAQANADAEVAINEAKLREAKAEANRKATEAEKRVAEAQSQIDMAACIAVKATGTECALIIAAQKGNMPNVLGGSVIPSVNVGK